MKCYGKACIIIEAFMCTSLYLTHDNLWHCMLKVSRPLLFLKKLSDPHPCISSRVFPRFNCFNCRSLNQTATLSQPCPQSSWTFGKYYPPEPRHFRRLAGAKFSPWISPVKREGSVPECLKRLLVGPLGKLMQWKHANRVWKMWLFTRQGKQPQKDAIREM